MYFLALSQAPPPEVIEIATNRPVTITPSSIAPTAENAAACDHVNREVDDDRRQHRKQRRDDHFLDRRLGQKVDRLAVIRLVGALHDAGLLAGLTPHFFDDGAGRAADR